MTSLRTRQAYQRIGFEGVRLTDAIDGSWTEPSLVLDSSSTVGSTTAKILVAAHVRRYPDGRRVNIPASTLTGKPFATEYGVFYTDATRLSTRATVSVSTDLKIAAHNYVTGQHLIGVVTTASSAGGSGTPGGSFPPGGGGSPSGDGYAIP